jgi:hypothetical protein
LGSEDIIRQGFGDNGKRRRRRRIYMSIFSCSLKLNSRPPGPVSRLATNRTIFSHVFLFHIPQNLEELAFLDSRFLSIIREDS